jgi:hypothetical protein
MGDTIKEIAKACQTLEGKDSSPTAGMITLIIASRKTARIILYTKHVENHGSKNVACPSF